MSTPFALGYASQLHEMESDSLKVRGRVPAWLSGTLVRNGPGQFEIGDHALQHWFDGLAQLHRFTIHEGRVSYANRFLQSRAYRDAKATGRVSRAEFATDPCRSIFGRLKTMFSPQITDNCNVNVVQLDDRFVALTETPSAIEFDPVSLETRGSFEYGDTLVGQHATAHPHLDSVRSEAVSYLTRFSLRSAYQVFCIPRGGRKRRLIAAVPVREPGYMHSFALTRNYAVLVEFPLVVKPWQLLLGGKSFIESYRWKPERPSRFIVVDRRDSTLHGIFESPAFFAFHHVNAFERGDEIIVDVAAYDDPTVIKTTYLDKLRNGPQELPTAQLRRYRIPKRGAMPGHDVLSRESIELPRINYDRSNAEDYGIAYGISTKRESHGDAANQLLRIDVRSGEAVTWSEPGTYPGEPVFVPAPNAQDEGEGMVLSVVLDVKQRSSFLLALNARSFEEIARAEVPQPIPFGFHGQFFGV
jgi:beta,beta-carotene 9',10'-dioxygenase